MNTSPIDGPPPRLLDSLKGRVVIRGGRVLLGTGRVEEATVVAVNGTISLSSEDNQQPAVGDDSVDVEASGCTVIPGLVDCHVHIHGLGGPDGQRRYIEAHPSVRVLRAASDALSFLRAGFTTIRHLGHGYAGDTRALKQALRAGELAGPRMVDCGWAASQSGGHGHHLEWPYSLVSEMWPKSGFCDGPVECRRFVREQAASGAEWIKVYTSEGVFESPPERTHPINFSPAEIEAIVDEAHALGLGVAAHSSSGRGSMIAVEAGVDTLEHGPDDVDETLIRTMLANHISFVPTLSVFEWAASRGAGRISQRAEASLIGRRRMAKAAYEAGVNVAAGSDSGSPPRGGSVNELLALERAGLEALPALRCATRGGAVALGLGDFVGDISDGKVSDLVVVRGRPDEHLGTLADRANVVAVVQGRSVLSRHGITQ